MVVSITCPQFVLHAGPQLTEAQAATLRPTPPSLVPRSGTFWSVSYPSTPPMPFDLYPALPAYRLPDGSWLVDDSSVPLPPSPAISAPAAARSLLSQPSLDRQQRLALSLLNAAAGSGIPDPTNSPPQGNPNPPQLLPPGSVPTNGTFWFLAETNWPPMPFNPCPGCDVYALSDGSYLVDDTAYSWPQPTGGGSTGAQGPYTPSFATGDLWLEITGVTNNMANLILHGTTAGTPYTILSRQSFSPADPWDAEQPLVGAAGQEWTPIKIPTFGRPTLFFRALVGSATPQRLWLCAPGISNSCFNCVLHGTSEGMSYDLRSTPSLGTTNNWTTETNFPGASGQFWTPVSIPLSGRPNLFLSARSWIDSNGSGIPDWWLLQYFGSTDIDPYTLCPSGDGWTYYQAYQHNWNPYLFYTPPAPTAWAHVAAGGNSRVIQWQAVSGPVQGYELIKYHVYDGWWPVQVSTQLVSAATLSITDTSIQQPADDPDINPDGFRDEYLLYALYSGGPSEPATIIDQTSIMIARLIHGPGEQLQLALLSTPKETTAIRLHLSTNTPCGGSGGTEQTIDIPLTAFTSNLYTLSEQVYPRYQAYLVTVQAIIPNGFAGLPHVVETDCQRTIRYPSLDASDVLKANLLFTLQAQSGIPAVDYPTYLYDTEGIGLGVRSGSHIPVYACASYHTSRQDGFLEPAWSATARPLHPWEINAAMLCYQYQVSNTLCWCFTNIYTGFSGGWASYGYYYTLGGPYAFDTAGFMQHGITSPCPSMLSAPAGRAINNLDPDPPINDNGSVASILSSHPNAYGLPLQGIYGDYWDEISTTQRFDYFVAGAVCPTGITLDAEQYAAPLVESDIYQFTVGGNLESLSPGSVATNGGVPLNPLIVASVGDPDFTVSPWLRYHLLNGTSGVYGYIEQYFDKAYRVGTNGNVTATETGILSPYGYFFPTEPGPVALLTMPNIENGQRGTGVVNVIKQELDVNHDGTMDLSFAGPDNTSQARPFVFWINNDYDRLHWVDGSDLEQDDLERVDSSVYSGQTDGNMDCAFHGYEGKPAIPCARDLEDYTRLWLPGMPSLMAVMPTNYTVKLTLNGDGQIRLFRAVEADGGTNYLFDEVTASNQVAQSYSLYVGLLSSSSPIILSRTNFSEHFIWCGAARGSAEVHLQVLDGNQNTVADTAAYIQLKDIKEMYERFTVGESASRGPYDTIYRASDGLTNGMTAFQYGAPESTNTPYILYVHGWNMKTWEKDCFAETAFKRLYLQGYQGRFGVFRWPTDNGFNGLWDAITDRRNYDRSEFNAWQSASLLSAFLSTNLCATYPGHVYLLAHSMGNVVAGEALRLATSRIVNTYVASQAAVPAHTYDGTIAQYSFSYLGLSYGPHTPNIYSNWFTPNGLGAGRKINFYNTNDYALQRPRWELNQLLKPDQATTLGWTYLFDGAPHDNIQSYTPGAPDDTPPWDWFQKEKGYSRIFFNIVSSPTDRYEVMSYAAQSRSTALGRTPAVGNLNGNVELSRSAPTRIWPPDPDDQGANQYSRHKWHSAQFRSTNMRQKGYWQTLLSEEGFNITP